MDLPRLRHLGEDIVALRRKPVAGLGRVTLGQREPHPVRETIVEIEQGRHQHCRIERVIVPAGDPTQEIAEPIRVYSLEVGQRSMTAQSRARMTAADAAAVYDAASPRGPSPRRPQRLKQIGRELNVRYVLEGSVQRGGNRMRVNVQLIDAETGGHLWAERFGGLRVERAGREK
jgi:hypothetical protein